MRVNSRTMTFGGIALGVIVVVIVAVVQLGGRVSGAITNPGIAYPADLLHDTAIGSATAPVTLEVYGDFQCPVCAKSALDVEPVLVSKYVSAGKLRIVHHDIAILGGKPTDPNNESRIAASGGVCALAQGKYWDYAHWTFGNQIGENAGEFTRDRLTSIATAAGLDGTAFRGCLDQSSTTSKVDEATQKAIAMGINTTPNFYLDGVSVGAGLKSVDDLSKLIDAEFAKVSASPSPPASGAASPSASPAASPSGTAKP